MYYFIYILACNNDTYYTGYTTDMERRYQEHLAGSAKCKYTRSFPPVSIAACWKIEANLSLVLKIEREIKCLSRQEKSSLIAAPKQLTKMLLARGMPINSQLTRMEFLDSSEQER